MPLRIPLTSLTAHSGIKLVARFFIFFLLLDSLSVFAQKTEDSEISFSGAVKGTITDFDTKQPIEFATVTVLKRHTTLPVGGTTTNASGNFVVDQLPPGSYNLHIVFIGYESITIDSITISLQTPERNTGIIRLTLNSKTLQGVTISAEAGIFQNGIDKKVYNVEKSIVSEGGSATDVLKNIPSISVDVDGNISLRGSGNITVLVDGKPSGLTGTSRAAVLEQIPASSIETIELITNPSAKYDPDGMSGILNVVLKKNKKQGINGSVSISAGTGEKYNTAFNLNYRDKKINLYTAYSFRYNTRTGSNISLRKNLFADTTYSLNQYTNNRLVSTTHMVKFGLDYSPDNKNEFGLSATGNLNNMKELESIKNNNLDSNGVLTGIYFRDNIETNGGYSLDLTGNYKRTFRIPKSEFLASINYSGNMNQNNFQFNQQAYNLDLTPAPEAPLLQNTYLHNTYKITTIQADYTRPLNDFSTLDVGYKSTIRQNDNDYQSESFNYAVSAFRNDTSITNHFIYNEQIHALYGIYTGGIRKLSYQIGCRAEEALTSSHLINTRQEFSHNYFNLYPSAHLLQKLNKDQEIMLSYSRRVNRPNARNLNPFPEYTDPLNLRFGNPSLNPEYINAYELTYSRLFSNFSFSSTAYYREILGMIQQIRTVAPSGVSSIVFQNLASGTNYGLELISRNDLCKWWNLTSNFNFFRTVIIGNNNAGELNNAGYSWSAKILSNMTVWKNMMIQVAGTYQAPTVIAQGSLLEMYVFDIGFKKDLLKQKMTLSANLSDIFNSRQMVSVTSASDFSQYSLRKRESRIAFITLTYRFGTADLSSKIKAAKIKDAEPEITD